MHGMIDGRAQPSRFAALDPRAKLLCAVISSLAAMLPLAPLAVYAAGFAAIVITADLVRVVGAQLRRLVWIFALLFVLDAALVGVAFATLITLRLVLLSTAFTLVVGTTTTDDLRDALRRIGLSRRLAFVVATALHAVPDFRHEWVAIREAQHARGLPRPEHAATWRARLHAAIPLLVPAVVMATQRAWGTAEAATARGLDAPVPAIRDRRPLAVADVALPGLCSVGFLTLWAWA